MRRPASQFAAWGRILAAAAGFVVTVPPICVAQESIEPRLLEWRSHSIGLSGNAARAMILRQFVAFDPRYLEQKRQFAPQITAAAAEIRDHEERGQSLPCSTQIYLEAKWLLNSTAFFDELNGMLDSFRDSLKTEDQRFANQQSAADGGWGACFKRKFKRLGA